MVGGASGGGGLAAGVALMARDRGEIDLFAQCLIYPMLDARNITASSQQFAEPHGRIWPRESNEFAWNALLGERSEEHTSELQSRGHLVCRLLLEKKKYMLLD